LVLVFERVSFSKKIGECRERNEQSVFQASRLGYDLGIASYFLALHYIIVMGGQVSTGYF